MEKYICLKVQCVKLHVMFGIKLHMLPINTLIKVYARSTINVFVFSTY